MKKIIFAAILVAASSHIAIADTAIDAYPDVASIPQPLSEQLRNGRLYEEQYIANVLGVVRNANATHMYLEKNDVEVMKQRRDKEIRGQAISTLMRYDANIDGIVTAAEIADEIKNRRSYETSSDEYVTREVNSLLSRYDTDKDGSITLKEMAAYKPDENYYGSREFERLSQFLALDPDKDGKLTVAELSGLAHKAFRTIDANGDGVIDPAEAEKLRKQPPAAAPPVAQCPVPAADTSDKIVFAGVYEGKTLTNVSVAGQSKKTTVIPVEIAKEADHLYLVLASYTPVIWQLTGDAQRLSHVVVVGGNADASGKTAAGVTGVSADKVTFLQGQKCLSRNFYDAYLRDPATTRAAVAPLTGRQPDVANTSYTAGRIKLTSAAASFAEAAAAPIPESFDAATWKDIEAYNNGGFMTLKVTDVVADNVAEEYKVLPGYAGLATLVHDGALQRVSDGRTQMIVSNGNNTTTFIGIKQVDVGNSGATVKVQKISAYKIVKEISAYPAGLDGNSTVDFIIAKGVKAPSGSPGSGCVTFEDPAEKTDATRLCR